MRKSILIILVLLLTNLCLKAQNEIEVESEEQVHSHHAGIFFGLSSSLEKHHTYFSLGADYELLLPKLEPKFGIGAFVELTFASFVEILGGIPIAVHPMEGLKVFIAPGFVYSNEKHEEASAAIIKYNPDRQLAPIVENVSTSKTNFLIRIGSAYSFHFLSLSIAPTFCVDMFAGTTSLVFGLTIGIGF